MQNHMNNYSVLRPVQTADQLRYRQGGASYQHSPPCCRGRTYGRRRAHARALPEAMRPLWEVLSRSLMSGNTAIILNNLYNGDGPAISAAPDP